MQALLSPDGVTREMVALGDRVYHGQVAGAPCAGCHGANGTGSPLGPDLTGKNGCGAMAACRNSEIDNGRRSKPEAISQPDATHGWGATHAGSSKGAIGLRLEFEPLGTRTRIVASHLLCST